MPWPDAALLMMLLVLFPLAALASQRRLAGTGIARIPVYLSSSMTLWALLVLLALVLWWTGAPWRGVGLRPAGDGNTLLWSAFAAVAGLAVVLTHHMAQSALGIPDSELMRQLMPRTGEEKLAFAVVVAPTAGICEELLFRGFVITRLETITGDYALAAALALIPFAIGHLYQGWWNALTVAALGAGAAWLFAESGSLWPAIVGHIVIDGAAPWLSDSDGEEESRGE